MVVQSFPNTKALKSTRLVERDLLAGEVTEATTVERAATATATATTVGATAATSATTAATVA